MRRHPLPRVAASLAPLLAVAVFLLAQSIPVAAAVPVRNELFQLTASDAGAGDAFGYALAADGNLAVVGAPFAGQNGAAEAGAAYVFDLTTHDELFMLKAADPDSGDHFGYAVSLFGSVAVVGAPGDDGPGAESGAAYVFDLTDGHQVFKLTSPDTAAGAFFGWSVAAHDTVVLVGAPHYDGNELDSGAAFLFHAGNGGLIKVLTTDPLPDTGDFGHAVALNGEEIVIGAPFLGALEYGAAYYYLRVVNYPFDYVYGLTQSWLGYSVAIGNQMVWGMPGGHCGYNTGVVQVSDISHNTGTLSPDSCRVDQFGWSVASRGATVLVGAPLDSMSEGTANLYTVIASPPSRPSGKLEAVFMPTEKQTLDRLGHSVALTADLALVGAPDYDGIFQDMGAVYAFDASLPTPVRLLSFTVRREGSAAVLDWAIAETGDLAGFHVFRQEPGRERTRLTNALLASRTAYRFVDNQPPSGPADYWLQELSRTGDTVWHGPVDLAPAVSVPMLTVGSAYPNPFFGATRLSFTLTRRAVVDASVFDLQGRRVATLMEKTQNPGTYEIYWDGSTESGGRAPTGVYLFRLRAGSGQRVQKVVLLPQG